MKLLLVDDHALFRSGVKLLVQQRSDNVAIVEAATAQEGLDIARHPDQPDLVLLDLNLPGLDGPDGVAGYVDTYSPRAPVVVVSGQDDPALAHACLSAGALAFVHKSSSPQQLEQVLDKYLLTGSTQAPGKTVDLTPRQKDVLDALALGWPNKEIARSLDVSPNTVKAHLAELFRLLGVNTRTMAVVRARHLGLIGATD